MSDKALAIYEQFDSISRAAVVLAKSGFFKDVQSEAQAIVKVMAGAELGLPPFASMSGISIIQGKPVLGANLIATLVKNDPRYDYRPVEHTDTACIIEWKEGGKVVGQSSFTWEEAARAQLTGKDNWKKYPSDMLFARAISRGARRFSPGIFGGSPIYTPDELGAEVDEDGNVLEGEIIRQPVTTPPANGKPAPSRDLWPADLLEVRDSELSPRDIAIRDGKQFVPMMAKEHEVAEDEVKRIAKGLGMAAIAKTEEARKMQWETIGHYFTLTLYEHIPHDLALAVINDAVTLDEARKQVQPEQPALIDAPATAYAE